MIDKKSIIKMASAIVRHDKGYPDRRLMHPQREWFIGLVLFAVILIAGSLLAGDIFLTYQNIELSEGDSGQSIPIYRESSVQNSLDLYQARGEEYDALREKKVMITSPTETSTTTSISAELDEQSMDITDIELAF